jgi:predicted CopG family antitoxin
VVEQIIQSDQLPKNSKYASISVPMEVKEHLKLMKGDKTWGDFLLEMCTDWQRLKSERAFHKLRKLLSEDDLKAISESSTEFREQFKLR